MSIGKRIGWMLVRFVMHMEVQSIKEDMTMPNYQYGGNSVALEIARKQIKLYKDALALCPKVMEVVKKFDGKVANKRLETALETIDKGLNCRKSTYTDIWEISFYTSDRSLTVKSESWDGKYTNYNSYYIKDNETYLARDMFKETYGSFTDENGRWASENICKQIEHNMKVMEENIAKYEEELRQVDDLEAERKRIKAEVEAFNKKVSWIGNEYFGLRI